MAILRPLPNPPPSLSERIKSLQNEIDAYIDSRVAIIAEDCKGLPLETIRNTLTREGCLCRSYFEVERAAT